MCATTRYPEAIPLERITAKNSVPILLQFFTHARCTKQFSLEFSPCELLSRRDIRGPLKQIFETWVNTNEYTVLSAYAQNLKRKNETCS